MAAAEKNDAHNQRTLGLSETNAHTGRISSEAEAYAMSAVRLSVQPLSLAAIATPPRERAIAPTRRIATWKESLMWLILPHDFAEQPLSRPKLVGDPAAISRAKH